jgi:ABC-type transport system involved in cytochrome bd biosynthesis fused ATPase/permease subunit
LLVIDNGRLVESGTHEELMEKRGAFYDLVMLQRELSQIGSAPMQGDGNEVS